MAKLLGVLDKVSESNNDYRTKLEDLKSSIDEKSTNFIGELVTASNYTIDFSSSIALAKEKLVNPISTIIESYVIKDLRSVESVNEQFVEKINDKIEETQINNDEEKKAFIDSLDNLLNEKYLEIVKIKRTNFFNETNTNDDIDKEINSFTEELAGNSASENDKDECVSKFKAALYTDIKACLDQISDLYQNNFVNEVSNALNNVVSDTPVISETLQEEKEEFKPFVPEINPVEQPMPTIEEYIPEVESPTVDETYNNSEKAEEDIININKPLVLIDEDRLPKLAEFVPPVLPSVRKKQKQEETVQEPVKESTPKKTYDVEEILKIAKSPIVMETAPLEEPKVEKVLEPIKRDDKEIEIDSSVDEKELVEEIIARLTKRLDEINARDAKITEEESQVKEDEDFVNDLINSANAKKEELDNFEKELDDKEEELKQKQADLDKKINDIMPFANAVLNEES